MVEFAGYEMPVVYGSIKEEHMAVRQQAGLFDVSHMSNVIVRGAGAATSLGRILSRGMTDLAIGRGRYALVLRDDGTIADDCFVFRTAEFEFHVIPNAGMNQIFMDALTPVLEDAEAFDESEQWGILALQGPEARDILAHASPDEAPKFHRILTMDIAGAKCLVSGTGYTGEKGVEIYVPAGDANVVWDALMAAGEAKGLRPIGLGARDTLRLEKGYALGSHEFEGARTPLEANLGFALDLEHDVPGRQRLMAMREQSYPVLRGLVQAKGVPRQGYAVFRGDQQLGEITSGTMSPSLGKGIAMAYLEGASIGDEVEVEARGRRFPAVVCALPFV